MAGEAPPPSSAEASYSIPESYEFDLDEELAPTNAFLDEVLTRVGEFALDTIEAVQEHPVLAASLVAATFGALFGFVLAWLMPRRPGVARPRPAPARQRARGLWARWAPRGRRPMKQVVEGRREPGAGDARAAAARTAQQARYVAQLLPIGVALLRNPIVRDLLAQALASRLRRTARL